jgi:hypothetical protein
MSVITGWQPPRMLCWRRERALFDAAVGRTFISGEITSIYLYVIAPWQTLSFR